MHKVKQGLENDQAWHVQIILKIASTDENAMKSYPTPFLQDYPHTAQALPLESLE